MMRFKGKIKLNKLPVITDQLNTKIILFLGYLITYLLEISGPLFIDDKLTTRFLYGARTYSFGFLTLPIIVALIITEWCLLRWAKRTADLYWSLIPFSVAFVLTLPLFLPEFPHSNMLFPYIYGLLISLVTISIKSHLENLELDRLLSQSTTDSQIAYLKEALALVKQILAGLVLGGVGFIAAFYPSLISNVSNSLVSDKGQAQLVLLNTGIQYAWFGIYYAIGPINVSFRMAVQLLSQMKQIAQPEISNLPPGNDTK